MNNQKNTFYLGSLALLLAVMGIVFIVNYVSNKAFVRFDLTEGKNFTLSQSTKDLLGTLPDVVTIKGIYSSNMPPPYNEYITEVKDLLREYEVYGKGKVRLELIDPSNNEEVQAELAKVGINPVILPVSGVDQAATLKVFASIFIEYLEKNETIPNVITIDTLEYDLTTTLQRMTSVEVPYVGLFKADAERNLDDEFGTLKQVLQKEFQVQEVSTAGGEPIDPMIQALIVANPFKVADRDLFEIDQFIMRGGRAIFLVDGVQVFLQPGPYGGPMPFYAMPLNPEIDSVGAMLAAYGVKRNYDLVQDTDHQTYPVLGPLGKPYPLFPIVDFTKTKQLDHTITQGLDYLVFTWASSLEIQGPPEGVKAEKLIVTSPESWVQSGQQMMVDPMQDPMPALPIPGMGPAERDLAVLLSGQFKSYFAGQPAPEVEAGLTGEAPPPREPGDRRDQSQETNILVVGCSKFVSNQNPVLINQDLSFILSSVEWMTGGQGLSDIRKRKGDVRPITRTLEVPQIVLAGLVAPLAGPVAVIIFGVVRFAFRSGKKKKFLEKV